jgi:hypothetical protein
MFWRRRAVDIDYQSCEHNPRIQGQSSQKTAAALASPRNLKIVIAAVPLISGINLLWQFFFRWPSFPETHSTHFYVANRS